MADRIEREIEEILKKIDKFPEGSRQPRIRRPSNQGGRPAKPSSGGSTRWLSAVSMRKVMMWALVAVIVAFFLRGIPGGYWLLIGAIIVFATAFFLSTRGGSAVDTSQKRWRGQTLDLSEPGWPDRIKAWFKGRKRR
jgi:hypothetical protein